MMKKNHRKSPHNPANKIKHFAKARDPYAVIESFVREVSAAESPIYVGNDVYFDDVDFSPRVAWGLVCPARPKIAAVTDYPLAQGSNNPTASILAPVGARLVLCTETNEVERVVRFKNKFTMMYVRPETWRMGMGIAGECDCALLRAAHNLYPLDGLLIRQAEPRCRALLLAVFCSRKAAFTHASSVHYDEAFQGRFEANDREYQEGPRGVPVSGRRPIPRTRLAAAGRS